MIIDNEYAHPEDLTWWDEVKLFCLLVLLTIVSTIGKLFKKKGKL